MSDWKDPGDYYRDKAETARILRRVIADMETLQRLEPHINYFEFIASFRNRLELAEYVGD